MAIATTVPKQFPVVPVVIGSVIAIGLIVGVIFLNRPAAQTTDSGPSSEAKAYLPNLQLSDVSMKASENFMQQRVVEIEGQITNKGPRLIERIEVLCIFPGVSDREVYRERVSIVTTKLASHQSRRFRLPFDNLPDSWNQAMPGLVISQIGFGN